MNIGRVGVCEEKQSPESVCPANSVQLCWCMYTIGILTRCPPVKIFRSHLCVWYGSVKVHSSRCAGPFFFNRRMRKTQLLEWPVLRSYAKFTSNLCVCENIGKISAHGIFLWSGEGATQFVITWNPFKIGLQAVFPFHTCPWHQCVGVVPASLRSA